MTSFKAFSHTMYNEYTALSSIYFLFLLFDSHFCSPCGCSLDAMPLWFLKLFSVQFNNSFSDDLHRVGFDCCSFLWFHDPHSITHNFPSHSLSLSHSLTHSQSLFSLVIFYEIIPTLRCYRKVMALMFIMYADRVRVYWKKEREFFYL